MEEKEEKETDKGCVHCGGHHLQKRGHSSSGKTVYMCYDCKKYFSYNPRIVNCTCLDCGIVFLGKRHKRCSPCREKHKQEYQENLRKINANKPKKIRTDYSRHNFKYPRPVCVHCGKANTFYIHRKKGSCYCKDCDAYFTEYNSDYLKTKKRKVATEEDVYNEQTFVCMICGVVKRNSLLYRKKKVFPYNICKECYKQQKRPFRVYGMTNKQYDDLLIKQNYSCAICHTPFNKKNRLCVDHCHTTGDYRGILCLSCNTMLGVAKDSVVTLYSAINYLSKEYFNEDS